MASPLTVCSRGKSLFLFLLCICFGTGAYTQNPTYTWAKRFGGTLGDYAEDVAVDPSGNVITVGEYRALTDFDPGPGVASNICAGLADAYVVKLNSAGIFQWAFSFGSTGNEIGRAVETDAAGNVYVAGPFGGTVDFDPGPGVYNLTPTGLTDFFLLKLDAAGNFVWAKAYGSTLQEECYGLEVDKTGCIMLAGFFFIGGDIDPGPGTTILPYVAGGDACILRLDRNGEIIWAKAFGGPNYDDTNTLTIDGACNIYVTGAYQSTVDFDPGPGVTNRTFNGGYDSYISKFDTLGNFKWVSTFGGTGTEFLFGSDVDSLGNFYCTGRFNSTTDFDPGPGTYNLSPITSFSTIVYKCDTAGNFGWARAFNSNTQCAGNGIKSDPAGNVFITGICNGISDFDPGPGTINLTSAGSADIYVARLDASGNYSFAFNVGSVGQDITYNITLDPSSNIYVSSHFQVTTDFDPGAGVANITSNGVQDGVIMKFAYTAPLAQTLLSFSGTALPDGNKLTWYVSASDEIDYFEIERSSDGNYFHQIGNVTPADPKQTSFSFHDSEPVKGANYYRLRMLKENGEIAHSEIVVIIKNSDQNEVLLFPNPTSDALNIYTTESMDNASLRIYSVEGNLLFETNNISGNQLSIPVADFAFGMYVIELRSGIQVSRIRFVRE